MKTTSHYLVSLSERAPGYLFPFFLLILEWVLRSAFQLNTQEFIGPTLAATGVGMTIALTSYRDQNKPLQNLPAELIKIIQEKKFSIETTASRVYRNVAWLLALILTLLWIWAIILSTQNPELLWGNIPAQYYPGILSFFIGLILSEVKEVI